jgi:short-subunit dehydrogenase
MASVVGQSALVIGGSSGMGRGAARAIAARGGDVTITSRSAGRLDEAVAKVGSLYLTGQVIVLDGGEAIRG